MNTPVRLHSISQTLGDAFHRASDLQKRRATLAASLIAVSRAGLRGEEIDAALMILRHGGDGAPVRRKLESLSRRFDDEYFRLREEGDSATKLKALLQFQKARAAAALAFALSSDSQQLHEAVYEAIIASEDQAEVVRSVEGALAGR